MAGRKLGELSVLLAGDAVAFVQTLNQAITALQSIDTLSRRVFKFGGGRVSITPTAVTIQPAAPAPTRTPPVAPEVPAGLENLRRVGGTDERPLLQKTGGQFASRAEREQYLAFQAQYAAYQNALLAFKEQETADAAKAATAAKEEAAAAERGAAAQAEGADQATGAAKALGTLRTGLSGNVEALPNALQSLALGAELLLRAINDIRGQLGGVLHGLGAPNAIIGTAPEFAPKLEAILKDVPAELRQQITGFIKSEIGLGAKGPSRPIAVTQGFVGEAQEGARNEAAIIAERQQANQAAFVSQLRAQAQTGVPPSELSTLLKPLRGETGLSVTKLEAFTKDFIESVRARVRALQDAQKAIDNGVEGAVEAYGKLTPVTVGGLGAELRARLNALATAQKKSPVAETSAALQKLEDHVVQTVGPIIALGKDADAVLARMEHEAETTLAGLKSKPIKTPGRSIDEVRNELAGKAGGFSPISELTRQQERDVIAQAEKASGLITPESAKVIAKSWADILRRDVAEVEREFLEAVKAVRPVAISSTGAPLYSVKQLATETLLRLGTQLSSASPVVAQALQVGEARRAVEQARQPIGISAPVLNAALGLPQSKYQPGPTQEGLDLVLKKAVEVGQALGYDTNQLTRLIAGELGLPNTTAEQFQTLAEVAKLVRLQIDGIIAAEQRLAEVSRARPPIGQRALTAAAGTGSGGGGQIPTTPGVPGGAGGGGEGEPPGPPINQEEVTAIVGKLTDTLSIERRLGRQLQKELTDLGKLSSQSLNDLLPALQAAGKEGTPEAKAFDIQATIAKVHGLVRNLQKDLTPDNLLERAAREEEAALDELSKIQDATLRENVLRHQKQVQAVIKDIQSSFKGFERFLPENQATQGLQGALKDLAKIDPARAGAEVQRLQADFIAKNLKIPTDYARELTKSIKAFTVEFPHTLLDRALAGEEGAVKLLVEAEDAAIAEGIKRGETAAKQAARAQQQAIKTALGKFFPNTEAIQRELEGRIGGAPADIQAFQARLAKFREIGPALKQALTQLGKLLPERIDSILAQIKEELATGTPAGLETLLKSVQQVGEIGPAIGGEFKRLQKLFPEQATSIIQTIRTESTAGIDSEQAAAQAFLAELIRLREIGDGVGAFFGHFAQGLENQRKRIAGQLGGGEGFEAKVTAGITAEESASREIRAALLKLATNLPLQAEEIANAYRKEVDAGTLTLEGKQKLLAGIKELSGIAPALDKGFVRIGIKVEQIVKELQDSVGIATVSAVAGIAGVGEGIKAQVTALKSTKPIRGLQVGPQVRLLNTELEILGRVLPEKAKEFYDRIALAAKQGRELTEETAQGLLKQAQELTRAFTLPGGKRISPLELGPADLVKKAAQAVRAGGVALPVVAPGQPGEGLPQPATEAQLQRLKLALAEEQGINSTLLGIRKTGDLTTRIFGNLGTGIVNATAALIRFQLSFAAFNAVFTIFSTAKQAFTDFTTELAKISAISRAGADDLALVAQRALSIGQNTSISAVAAIKGFTQILDLGVGVKDSLQAIDTAVKVSLGTNASLEDSVKLVASAYKAFDLGQTSSTHAADILTIALNKTKLTATTLNQAIETAGPLASKLGISFEEFATGAGIIAESGIKGFTSYLRVLTALETPTTKAALVFKGLGLSLDQVNPRGGRLIQVLQTLHDAGFGAEQAIEAFSIRGASGAVALVKGAAAANALRDAMNQTGAAFEAARLRQESLEAQTEKAKNQFTNFAITLGQDLAPGFILLAKGAQSLLGDLSVLRGPLEGLTVGLLGFVAAVKGGTAILGLFGLAGEELAAAAALTGPLGILAGALAAVAAGFVFVKQRQAEQTATVQENVAANQGNIESTEKLIVQFNAATDALGHALPGTLNYTNALADLHTTVKDLVLRFPALREQILALAEAARGGQTLDIGQLVRPEAAKEQLETVRLQIKALQSLQQASSNPTEGPAILGPLTALKRLGLAFTTSGASLTEDAQRFFNALHIDAHITDLKKTEEELGKTGKAAGLATDDINDLKQGLAEITAAAKTGDVGLIADRQARVFDLTKEKLLGVLGPLKLTKEQTISLSDTLQKAFAKGPINEDTLQHALAAVGSNLDKAGVAGRQAADILLDVLEQARKLGGEGSDALTEFTAAIEKIDTQFQKLQDSAEKSAAAAKASADAFAKEIAAGGSLQSAEEKAAIAGQTAPIKKDLERARRAALDAYAARYGAQSPLPEAARSDFATSEIAAGHGIPTAETAPAVAELKTVEAGVAAEEVKATAATDALVEKEKAQFRERDEKAALQSAITIANQAAEIDARRLRQFGDFAGAELRIHEAKIEGFKKIYKLGPELDRVINEENLRFDAANKEGAQQHADQIVQAERQGAQARTQIRVEELRKIGDFADAETATHKDNIDNINKLNKDSSIRNILLEQEQERHQEALKKVTQDTIEFQIAKTKQLIDEKLLDLEVSDRIAKAEFAFQQEQINAGRSQIFGQSRAQADLDRRKALQQISADQGLVAASDEAINTLLGQRAQLQADISTQKGHEVDLNDVGLTGINKEIDAEARKNATLKSNLQISKDSLQFAGKALEVSISFGSAFENAFKTGFEALRTGKGKFSDILKGLGDGIAQEIEGGLAKALVKKLGFDNDFILNMQGLGTQGGDLIHQGIGGGLTGALDNVGLFAKSALGIFGDLGTGAYNAVSGLFGASPATNPLADLVSGTTSTNQTPAAAGQPNGLAGLLGAITTATMSVTAGIVNIVGAGAGALLPGASSFLGGGSPSLLNTAGSIADFANGGFLGGGSPSAVNLGGGTFQAGLSTPGTPGTSFITGAATPRATETGSTFVQPAGGGAGLIPQLISFLSLIQSFKGLQTNQAPLTPAFENQGQQLLNLPLGFKGDFGTGSAFRGLGTQLLGLSAKVLLPQLAKILPLSLTTLLGNIPLLGGLLGLAPAAGVAASTLAPGIGLAAGLSAADLATLASTGTSLVGPGTAVAGSEAATLGVTGATGAAAATTGIASLLGSLAAIIGPVASIAALVLSAKSHFDTTNALNKVELGAPEARNFGVVGGIGLAVGAGLGAGIGSIFPGIGTLAGAAIGAAIAQVIETQVASSIAGGIAKAEKGGLKQKDLNEAVLGSPAVKALDITDISGISELVIKNFLIPSIEDIFDKLLVKVIEKTSGFGFDRRLTKFGQGLTPAKQQEEKQVFGKGTEGGTDLNAFLGFITRITGAFGTDVAARIMREFNILANNIVRDTKDAAAAELLLLKLTRELFSGSLLVGLQFIKKFFTQDTLRNITNFGHQTDLLVKAFAKVLPGTNVKQLVDIIRATPGALGDTIAITKSTKAVAKAAPDLFSGGTFEAGFENFVKGLENQVQSAFQKGLVNALVVHGPLGDALAGFFHVLRHGIQKAIKDGGLGVAEEARLGAKLELAGQKIRLFLETYKSQLQRIYDFEKKIQKQLEDLELTPDQSLKKLADAINNIKDKIESAILNLITVIKNAAEDNINFVQSQFVLRKQHFEQAAPGEAPTLQSGGTNPVIPGLDLAEAHNIYDRFTANKSVLSPENQISLLKEVDGAIQNYLSATIEVIKDKFQPMIDLAVHAKKIFDSVSAAITQIKTNASAAVVPDREKIDLLQKQIADQQRIFQTSTGETRLQAADKLQTLLPQLLDVAGKTLDQSGPQYQGIFNQVVRGLEDIQNDTRSAEKDLADITKQMNDALHDANKNASDFYAKTYTDRQDAYLHETAAAQTTIDGIVTAILGPNGGNLNDALAALKLKTPDQLDAITQAIEAAQAAQKAGVTATPPPGTPESFTEALAISRRTGLGTDVTSAALDDTRPGRKKDARREIFHDLRLYVGGFEDAIRKAAKSGVDANFVNAAHYIGAGLKGIIDDVLSYTGPAGAVAAFTKAETNAETVKTILADKPQLLRLLDAAIDSLPKLALGGILTAPTAIGGEAGNEAVIPLNARGMGFLIDAMQEALASRNRGLGELAAHISTFTQHHASAHAQEVPHITLNIADGAITMNVEKADAAALEALPRRTLEAIKTSIARGELGAVIKERVR